jgi:hypothetical protein
LRPLKINNSNNELIIIIIKKKKRLKQQIDSPCQKKINHERNTVWRDRLIFHYFLHNAVPVSFIKCQKRKFILWFSHGAPWKIRKTPEKALERKKIIFQ